MVQLTIHFGDNLPIRRDRPPESMVLIYINCRGVHSCKMLLGQVFGRTSFQNETIRAFDSGVHANARSPAKHASIDDPEARRLSGSHGGNGVPPWLSRELQRRDAAATMAL